MLFAFLFYVHVVFVVIYVICYYVTFRPQKKPTETLLLGFSIGVVLIMFLIGCFSVMYWMHGYGFERPEDKKTYQKVSEPLYRKMPIPEK